MAVALNNRIGKTLTMVVRFPYPAPHRPVLLIHNGRGRYSNAVRLCVRGNHVNRASDQEGFRRTHLHLRTPEFGDKHAVDPSSAGWPSEDWDEQNPSPPDVELPRIVAAFCRMHAIPFEPADVWTDPDWSPQLHVLPEGDEIP